jgi:predicted acylesterase/phospholipase RssA
MESAQEQRWELWGPLADRYRTPGPRRILALDGGGIRGLITLGVLERLESELADRLGRGPEFRLSDYFDLIGGTSTGAIIAAALARGMSVAELTEFYRDFGRDAFTKRSIFARWKSLYVDEGLAQKLQVTFGKDTDLSPENLASLLVVVTRNTTTDSAWPVSSNPFAKYNDPDRPDCNLRIPLWQLVRASTAAPVFFPPEVITWDPKDPSKSFVFVDGGTTVYNNPSFLLFRMATEPAYRLGWPTGERDLLVVSVGTGGAPVLGATVDDPETNLVSAALNTLSAVMAQASVDQDINCRVIGRCSYGGIVDRELHDLIADDPGHQDRRVPLETDTGKAFLYVRYNAELTANGLEELGLAGLDPKKVARLDAVDRLDDLQEIGRAVASRVDLAHLGSFVP